MSGLTPKTLLNHYVDGTYAPNVPTFFFRSTFDIDAQTIESVAGLGAEVVFDDAILVYVNGEGVYDAADERTTDTSTTSSTPATRR